MTADGGVIAVGSFFGIEAVVASVGVVRGFVLGRELIDGAPLVLRTTIWRRRCEAGYRR